MAIAIGFRQTVGPDAVGKMDAQEVSEAFLHHVADRFAKTLKQRIVHLVEVKKYG